MASSIDPYPKESGISDTSVKLSSSLDSLMVGERQNYSCESWNLSFLVDLGDSILSGLSEFG